LRRARQKERACDKGSPKRQDSRGSGPGRHPSSGRRAQLYEKANVHPEVLGAGPLRGHGATWFAFSPERITTGPIRTPPSATVLQSRHRLRRLAIRAYLASISYILRVSTREHFQGSPGVRRVLMPHCRLSPPAWRPMSRFGIPGRPSAGIRIIRPGQGRTCSRSPLTSDPGPIPERGPARTG